MRVCSGKPWLLGHNHSAAQVVDFGKYPNFKGQIGFSHRQPEQLDCARLDSLRSTPELSEDCGGAFQADFESGAGPGNWAVDVLHFRPAMPGDDELL